MVQNFYDGQPSSSKSSEKSGDEEKVPGGTGIVNGPPNGFG